jgi:hypothetical protein
MIVAGLWLALMAAGLGLEIVARWRPGPAGLGAILGRIAARSRVARIVLVLGWAWVGWHFFARYTIHPL